MSVNKVILIGNVGQDPEIRYVDTRPVATFSLATTERAYTTASGAQVPERTEWHRIVMWDRHAETAEKYIRKGVKRELRHPFPSRFHLNAIPRPSLLPRWRYSLTDSFPFYTFLAQKALNLRNIS